MTSSISSAKNKTLLDDNIEVNILPQAIIEIETKEENNKTQKKLLKYGSKKSLEEILMHKITAIYNILNLNSEQNMESKPIYYLEFDIHRSLVRPDEGINVTCYYEGKSDKMHEYNGI